MGGGILVRVGLAPALLVVLVLVIVMMVVIRPQEGLLILTEPGDSSVLLARGLLGDDGGAVDVVVLHMRGLDLVDGVDGQRVLQAAVGYSTVQQGLGYEGGGHSGDVVGNPGLHV